MIIKVSDVVCSCKGYSGVLWNDGGINKNTEYLFNIDAAADREVV